MSEFAPTPATAAPTQGPAVAHSALVGNPELMGSLSRSMANIEIKKRPTVEEGANSFYDKLESVQGMHEEPFKPMEEALAAEQTTKGDIATKLIDSGVTFDELDAVKVQKMETGAKQLKAEGRTQTTLEDAPDDLRHASLITDLTKELVAAKAEGWDETPSRRIMANQVAQERGEELPFPELFKSAEALGETATEAQAPTESSTKPEDVAEPKRSPDSPAVAHSALNSLEAVQEAASKFNLGGNKENAEPQSSAEHEQDDRNREVLRQAEYGVVLEQAYIEATALDPRLEEIEIAPLPDDVPSVARVLQAWRSESGRHRVEIPLSNIDERLRKQEELIKSIPGGRKLFADKIGISEDKLTPEVMLVFGFLHELGHVTEFMDHEANPKELEVRMKREKEALPIGKATVSRMLDKGSDEHKFITENWDEISSRLGVRSVGELIEKQHVAYRSMTSEAHADDFADLVLRMNPTMVDQLIGPNREQYRRYAMAA